MSLERKRRDAGALQITDRDIATLSWIAQQYCMSYDQLHRLLAHFGDSPRKDTDKVSYSATLNAVQRWLQLGLIDTPQKILRGYTTHVWLSRRGLHQLGLPYAYYVPKPSSIPHCYAANAVRFHLQCSNVSALWESERTLKLQIPEATERRPLPDAELHVSKVPIIAVQVLEQQKLDTIYKIQDAIHGLSVLTMNYTCLWCFVPFETLPTLQQMVNNTHRHMQDRFLWIGTKGKEYSVAEAPMKEKA
jgi:uncharacterized protein YqiB (DUF1249 family)